jgi:glycosyltransferase involved in cell wall biosynthesis
LTVLQLSQSDTGGGAALAAYRLHTALNAAGTESRMLVLRKHSDDPTVQTIRPHMDMLSRMRRILKRRQSQRAMARYAPTRRHYTLFTDSRAPWDEDVFAQMGHPDVLHAHWTYDMVEIARLGAFARGQMPMVWTHHDIAGMTGGCHYPGGCSRWQTGCGLCPELGSHDIHDLSAYTMVRKQRVFPTLQPADLHHVAPSQWLKTLLERSPLYKHLPVTVIPNGIDTDVFHPSPPLPARQVLFDLHEPDTKIILFVSHAVDLPSKGFSVLMDALHHAALPPNVVCVSIGAGKMTVPSNVRHIHIDSIHDPRLLAHCYSAADLFVIPSLDDNLPNTVLESLACGTPVVGFATGGIPDMVRSGVTGETVPTGDAAALAAALRALLDDDDKRSQLSRSCREVAVREYGLPLQAERMQALYASVHETWERAYHPQSR